MTDFAGLLDRHIPDPPRGQSFRDVLAALPRRPVVGRRGDLAIVRRLSLCRCTTPPSHVRVLGRPYDWAAESAAGSVPDVGNPPALVPAPAPPAGTRSSP